MHRRGFLSLFASVPFLQGGADVRQSNAGRVLGADEGELVLIGSRQSPVRVKVDSNGGQSTRLGMITEHLAPRTGVPVHRHLAEDEIIFIHQGEGTATLGEDQHLVKAGATVFVPKETWHGLQNTGSETLIMLAIYAPAGFEGYFREIGNAPGAAPRGTRSQVEAREIDRRFRIEYR